MAMTTYDMLTEMHMHKNTRPHNVLSSTCAFTCKRHVRRTKADRRPLPAHTLPTEPPSPSQGRGCMWTVIICLPFLLTRFAQVPTDLVKQKRKTAVQDKLCKNGRTAPVRVPSFRRKFRPKCHQPTKHCYLSSSIHRGVEAG